MSDLKVLVIDDEPVICDACHLILTEKGYTVERRMTGKSGLMAIEQGFFDVIILDLKLSDVDGMDVLKIIRENKPDLPVIIITGYSTISIAVEALKLGASEYISKPFTDDELICCIEKIRSNDKRENSKEKKTEQH